MSIPWPELTKEQWEELLAHPERRETILAPFCAQVFNKTPVRPAPSAEKKGNSHDE